MLGREGERDWERESRERERREEEESVCVSEEKRE